MLPLNGDPMFNGYTLLAVLAAWPLALLIVAALNGRRAR